MITDSQPKSLFGAIQRTKELVLIESSAIRLWQTGSISWLLDLAGDQTELKLRCGALNLRKTHQLRRRAV